jgi:hypothetical protein
MRKLFSKKRLIVLTIVAVAIGAAGGGYAYFTSTGTGNGTGKVGQASNWTVVGASEAGNLYPLVYPNGAQALTGGSVTNAGSGNQNLTQIVATIQTPTGGSNTPNACTAADFGLSSPGATWTISGANNGTATITFSDNLAPGASHPFSDLSVSMVDNGANQDGCQNATVHIKYDAS